MQFSSELKMNFHNLAIELPQNPGQGLRESSGTVIQGLTSQIYLYRFQLRGPRLCISLGTREYVFVQD